MPWLLTDQRWFDLSHAERSRRLSRALYAIDVIYTCSPVIIVLLSQCSRGRPYRQVGATLVRIVKEEGGAALFKGLTARVAWIGLGG